MNKKLISSKNEAENKQQQKKTHIRYIKRE